VGEGLKMAYLISQKHFGLTHWMKMAYLTSQKKFGLTHWMKMAYLISLDALLAYLM